MNVIGPAGKFLKILHSAGALLFKVPIATVPRYGVMPSFITLELLRISSRLNSSSVLGLVTPPTTPYITLLDLKAASKQISYANSLSRTPRGPLSISPLTP